MSFYQSLHEVDGVLLLGGGDSTKIAGLVAMGHRIAILALAVFQGQATRIWEALRPGRDLPSADEISLMARPNWTSDTAVECARALQSQLFRREEEKRLARLEDLRRETAITWHAVLAVAVFLLSLVMIPLAWTGYFNIAGSIALLFFAPVLAGVAGSTIRLVFDLRQGVQPLSRQSAITTAALGLNRPARLGSVVHRGSDQHAGPTADCGARRQTAPVRRRSRVHRGPDARRRLPQADQHRRGGYHQYPTRVVSSDRFSEKLALYFSHSWHRRETQPESPRLEAPRRGVRASGRRRGACGGGRLPPTSIASKRP